MISWNSFQQSKDFFKNPVEAVKHLPVELKEDNPDIDWRAIAGLRDILIHAYFGIDEDIIWDIIENKIPVFKKQIKRLIAESD